MKKVIMSVMAGLLVCTSAFAWSSGKVQRIYVNETGTALVKIKGVNHYRNYLTIGSGNVSDVNVQAMMEVLLSAQRTNTTIDYDEVSGGYYRKMKMVCTDTQLP